MSEADIREERIKKLAALKTAGMEGFPVSSARKVSIADILASFEQLESQSSEVCTSGRIMSRRGQGGIVFVDLYDGTGRVQLVLQKSEMDETSFSLFTDAVDTGDFLDIAGTCFVTKRGERSIQVKTWTMLSKSLRAIPSEWFGVKDEETKLRERTIDMLIDQELHAMVVRRGKFWRAIREYLYRKDFLEVETPVLETTPGGADARPFVTHHNALDIDVYLRISAGELWQKRLLISGFPKVFEIGRIFRNEGQSREHLQDYTQLETYEAYSDMRKGMKFVQDLYRHVAKEVYGKYTFEIHGHTVDLADEWREIDFCELLSREYGIDPIACTDEQAIEAVRSAGIPISEELNKSRAVDLLWKKLRKTISGPAFLIGVPVFLEPLAKRSEKNSATVDRLQVILAGSEVGKGYSELNDPIDQRARFEEQQKLREAGDDEAQRLDDDYIRDMEYGMPPAFGFGVSERLFAFLENRSAHETQIFPLLKPVPIQLSKKEAEKKYRSKRFVVIADPSVGYGVAANAIGQLGISMGSFSHEKLFDMKTMSDADGKNHYTDGLYPMVNLSGDQKTMAEFVRKCYEGKIQVFDFSEIMRKAHSDKEMQVAYASQKTEQIRYIAVGALVPSDFEKQFLDTLSRFE